MYEAHFGLNANPFSSSPSPEFIYESAEHREALAHFRFALANREAFLLLTGEVGTGKTTAVQALRRMLAADTPVAVVTHTTLEPRELLEEIALRFGLEPEGGDSKPVLMRRLERFLRDRRRTGGHALVVLDEAHLLSPALLEEVRLLSNLEAEEGGKLLQICLVGQPELQTHLQQPELRQLRQRISVRYALKPLTAEETAAYIYHRLMAAGANHPSVIFPAEATTAVHALSQGIPREINVLAGQAMLNAYLDEAGSVTRGHVFSAKSDYGFQGIVTGAASLTPDVPPPPTPRRVPTAVPPRPAPAGPAAPGTEERRAGGPPRRPIPLPPDSLRPEPPEGRSEPAPAAAPSPPPREPAAASGRTPGRLAAGPGLAEPRRRRGGDRRGLTWAGIVILSLVLVMAFGWWQTVNEGQAPSEEAGSASREAVPAGGLDPAGSPGEAGSGESGVEPSGEPDRAADGEEGARRGSGGERGGEPDGTGAASGDGPGTPPSGSVRPEGGESPPAAVEVPAGQTAAGGTAGGGSPAAEPPEAGTVPEGSSTAAGGAQAEAEAEAPLAIQVASFRTRTRANEVLAQVTEQTGLPGVVLPAEVDGVLWYRILLGSFRDAEEARRAADPLLRRRVIREVVTREIPEAWVGTLSGRGATP